MPYIPTTEENRKEMLKAIGVSEFDDLLKRIPKEALFQGELDLPQPLSEFEVTKLIKEIAAENEHTGNHVSFLGGGAYDHFIPAAIDHITSRPEFYTAYTPYQPEVSQGTLQTIYEFQTMICNLTGMDVSNASVYDGATALAEAALLANGQTRRPEVLVSQSVHPFHRSVIQTYCHRSGVEMKVVPAKDGATDLDQLKAMANDKTAALLVQHPNFFGCLEPVEEMETIIHDAGGLYVVSADPISLALLKPPGEYGADVATGEGQGLGISQAYGGPYVGIFTVSQKLIRRLPGRLVGMTEDTEGRRGYVLTLQTREQHIRREKATSSICTNQQLCALAATVYMSLMGKHGLTTVAHQSTQKTHYLAKELQKIDGVSLMFDRPFFKEFVIQCPKDPQLIIDAMRKEKIFAGVHMNRFDYGMDNGLLVAVTEKRTKEEMDRYVALFKKLVA